MFKYYIKLMLILAAIDEWFRKNYLARMVTWIVFASEVNIQVVGPLIRMILDPNPSVWLEMGIMVPLNISMSYFWDAFRLWFWQAVHQWVEKYIPKQEETKL